METITRNVKEIESADRQALEHVIGKPLSESEMVIIQIVNVAAPTTEKAQSGQMTNQSAGLPTWCNVYQGLSDEEIADIESAIVRSHGSRTLR